MARMRPPHVPDEPPPVLRDEELRRLLGTCERGTNFEDRRDAAIIRVFIDTGARRAEVAGLRYMPADEASNDVDLDRAFCGCSEKGDESGSSGSARRPSERWIDMSGCANARLMPRCRGCGSAEKAD